MERHPGRAAPGHLAAAARLPAAQPGAQVRRGALARHVSMMCSPARANGGVHTAPGQELQQW